MVSSTTPPSDPVSDHKQGQNQQILTPEESTEKIAEQATVVETAFIRALEAAELDSHRIWVAFSGGLDSTVLLHLAAGHRHKELFGQLCAIHVDHNIAADSAAWAEHCAAQAGQLQVPFTLCKVPADELVGGNLEQRAREARYRLIAAALSPDDLLLTAHHRRDQAETVLLQLFRGGGVRGTAAMGELSAQHGIKLLRPLLDVDPQALRSYSVYHNLHWIEDPSNQQIVHDRNYLRHQVMPRLRQRWPGLDQALARSARLHAQSSELADDLAAIDLTVAGSTVTKNNLQAEPASITLNCESLIKLSPHRRSNLLRYWLMQMGYPVPSEIQLRVLQQSLLYSRADRSPVFTWRSSQVYRYRGELVASLRSNRSADIATEFWCVERPLLIKELGWQLSAHSCAEGPRMKWLPDRPLTVVFRQGGEVMQLHGHHRKLKKLFQEWGVPPGDRQRLPLIFADQELLAVPGYAVADSVRVTDGGEGWQLSWQAILPKEELPE